MSTIDSPLKKVSIITKVLYQYVQQKKEQDEELGFLIDRCVSIEETLSKIDPSQEPQFSGILKLLLSGLERVHDLLKKFDNYKRLILFRYENEIKRITKYDDRFFRIEAAIIKGVDEVTNFQFVDLLDNDASKSFWQTFGTNVHQVTWNEFLRQIVAEFDEQPQKVVDKLKRILDPFNMDQVLFFTFADFVGQDSIEDALHKLSRKKRSDLRSLIIDDEDPVREGSVWRGSVCQTGCHDFDVVLEVKQKEGNDIEGLIHWCSNFTEDITSFRGQLFSSHDFAPNNPPTLPANLPSILLTRSPSSNNSSPRETLSRNPSSVAHPTIQQQYDTIIFEEVSAIQGNGVIPLPNTWKGTIVSKDKTIKGEWSHGDQNGEFQFTLDTRVNQELQEEHQRRSFEKNENFMDSDLVVRVLVDGYLLKKGRVRKSWKRRYFVLKKGLLTYYKSREHYPVRPSGRVEMRDLISISEAPDTNNHQNCFQMYTNNRKFKVQADSAEDRAVWIDAIEAQMKKFHR